MLVLSRHRDESIWITTPSGERIKVTVVELRGDKVRLGFDADTSVIIHREEVEEAIQRENERLGHPKPTPSGLPAPPKPPLADRI